MVATKPQNKLRKVMAKTDLKAQYVYPHGSREQKLTKIQQGVKAEADSGQISWGEGPMSDLCIFSFEL